MLCLLKQPALTERVVFHFLRLQDVVSLVLACSAARHLRFRPKAFFLQDPRAWTATVLDLSAVETLELSPRDLRKAPMPKSVQTLKLCFSSGTYGIGRTLRPRLGSPTIIHTLALPVILSVADVDFLESYCPLLRSLTCSGVLAGAEQRLGQMRLDELSLCSAPLSNRALPPGLRTLRLGQVKEFATVKHALGLANLSVLVVQAVQRVPVQLSVFSVLHLETLWLGYFTVDLHQHGLPAGLRRLYLSNCVAVTDGTAIDLRMLTCLEECDLGSVYVSGIMLPVGLTALSLAVMSRPLELGGAPNLKTLGLFAQNIDPTAFESLLTSFPCLERLDLRSRVSREVLMAPRVQAVLHNLKALSLHVEFLGGDTRREVLEATGPDLRELELHVDSFWRSEMVVDLPRTLTERLTHFRLGSTVVKSDKRGLTSLEKFLEQT